MVHRSRKRWLIGLGVYAGLCFVLGFFPTYGSPHFRYTGSDPSVEVWNLGWPVATIIWDPRTGLHVGPFAYVLFPILILVGIAAIVFVGLCLSAVSSRTSCRT
jgi:hypothetical protein